MEQRTLFGFGRAIAISAVALIACTASAAWGLKFEVWNGSAWVQSVTVPSGAAKTIKFRFGAYFDESSPPEIVTPDGTGTAMALARFTGSNEGTNFAYEDRFKNVVRTVSSGNPTLIVTSGGTIGTTSMNSFGRQLFLSDVPFEPYKEIYVGEVGLSADWSARHITLRNRTFGAGQFPGLMFYNSASPTNKQSAGPSSEAGRVDINAQIIVTGEDTCPSDFNNDGIVDDADFVRFVREYDLTLCSSVEMLPGCVADLDHDRIVNDDDFLIFVYSYNRAICP